MLSPKGVNFEEKVLMSIKASLEDPHAVLENWDGDSVDPCSWTMVTCSAESLVIGLLLLQNNITGPIPAEIGRLSKLHTLDLSNNFFDGEVPASLGHLKRGLIIRVSGAIPVSLANMTQLVFLDFLIPGTCLSKI